MLTGLRHDIYVAFRHKPLNLPRDIFIKSTLKFKEDSQKNGVNWLTTDAFINARINGGRRRNRKTKKGKKSKKARKTRSRK